MKKAGNILFWVLVIGIATFALYTFYNRYKPQALRQPPSQSGQSSEGTGNAGREKGTTGKTGNKPEKVMAPDFTLKDVNGKEVSLSDYKGKIVFLNFWTTWCGYCRQEMPDLDSAGKEFEKGNDAVILTVNVQEDEKTVKEYLSKNKLSLPVLMDVNGEVAGMYGVSAFPTTFIINRDDSANSYIPGATNAETLRSVVEKIKEDEK